MQGLVSDMGAVKEVKASVYAVYAAAKILHYIGVSLTVQQSLISTCVHNRFHIQNAGSGQRCGRREGSESACLRRLRQRQHTTLNSLDSKLYLP